MEEKPDKSSAAAVVLASFCSTEKNHLLTSTISVDCALFVCVAAHFVKKKKKRQNEEKKLFFFGLGAIYQLKTSAGIRFSKILNSSPQLA